MSTTNQLFGMPASLYTAKVRSYLIKQQIPFVERVVGDTYFGEKIVPVVGRLIMPVVESDEGDIVQDGADIIDYFEAQQPRSTPAIPGTAVHRAVSYLFESFGGEGLLRPAMHYRWNFDDRHLAFLKNDFCVGLMPNGSAQECEAAFEFASGQMRKATQSFGVTDASIPLIEASYAEFLKLFSAHLSESNYLLGGHATLGDFGLVSALYAHLARDPVPAELMRTTAPEVSRWVERMNSPQSFVVKPSDGDPQLFADDGIPFTLKAMMAFIAEEYLPELIAHTTFANDWLSQQTDLKAGTNGLDDPGRRFIGRTEFEWRGITLKTTVMPYRFYLLQRLQDSVVSASEHEQQVIRALFEETGLIEMLDLRTHRRVERVNHLEVWGSES